MEALQKTITPTNAPEQVSEMDRRLEAIKEILVGNQIDRIDRKYKGLNQRMESTSSHLIGLVDDLSKELVKLKKEQDQSLQQERKERFKETDNLRDRLQELSNENQQATNPGAVPDKVQRMARRVQELENLAHAFTEKQKEMANKLRSEWKNDLSQRMEQQDEKNKTSREDLQSNLQSRLKNLEESFDQKLSLQENKVDGKIQENKNKLHELADALLGHQKHTDAELKKVRTTLEAKSFTSPEQQVKNRAELEEIKKNNAFLQNKTEQELADIRQAIYKNQSQQNELESELTQVMDKLATKVSQRLKKNDEEVKNLGNLLNESNKALAEAHHEHDQRIRENEEATQELHKFLEDELVPHLQTSSKSRKELDQKFENLQAHFDQKLREVSARMEGRMDGMLKMKEQESQKVQQAWDQRKQDIKGTLKKLSQLLDE